MYSPVLRDPFIFVEDHISSEDEKSIEICFYKCKTIMKKCLWKISSKSEEDGGETSQHNYTKCSDSGKIFLYLYSNILI